ncbi:expressed unknown protein [Seminavis robusta]|uniref:DUF4336 domain-containing protein n=1 Tax=Seminavis robusta TaxID=568900 RepID=A0A9N8DNV8_9STRA|nr:expressed unknown protein [Seminavis robusta]|eukprot:Sro183_g079790.1 n/a (273) ;mRNA; r:96477-97295
MSMSADINTSTSASNTSGSRLIPFAVNLWLVEGPVVSFYGFPYPTRMAVISIPDSSMDTSTEVSKCSWIWSPISLDDELASEVERTAGPVKHIVSPNCIHWLFMKEWQDRFPQAKMYASPCLQERECAAGLKFEPVESFDEPHPSYAAEIDQTVFDGGWPKEVVFFHKPSKTVIFTDLIQRQPIESLTGIKGWIMKMDGVGGENGSTPREWRLLFRLGRKRDKARQTLDHILLDWKPEKLVIAHGQCEQSNAAAVVESCLHWIPPKHNEYRH